MYQCLISLLWRRGVSGGKRRSSSNPQRERKERGDAWSGSKGMKLPGGERGFPKTGEEGAVKEEKAWPAP